MLSTQNETYCLYLSEHFSHFCSSFVFISAHQKRVSKYIHHSTYCTVTACLTILTKPFLLSFILETKICLTNYDILLFQAYPSMHLAEGRKKDHGKAITGLTKKDFHMHGSNSRNDDQTFMQHQQCCTYLCSCEESRGQRQLSQR